MGVVLYYSLGNRSNLLLGRYRNLPGYFREAVGWQEFTAILLNLSLPIKSLLIFKINQLFKGIGAVSLPIASDEMIISHGRSLKN